MAETYGKYANRPIIFNVSSAQSKTDGSSAVDWKTLATHPQVAGGYCSIGEIDGVANTMTLESDKWMDPSFDSNFNDLIVNKLWTAPEIGFDPGWFTNRGWSTGGVDAMFVGKTDDEIATNLFNEPHIYLYVRKIKNGSGRVFTPSKIKNLSEKPSDAVVIKYTKYWLLNSNTIFDMHSGKALETLIKGLNWLMNKGYIKLKPILIKTNQWFLSNYAPFYGQTVVNANYTISSHNYWDEKKGPANVNFEGLIEQMKLIIDSYHPPYLGKPNLLCISEGYFTLPEISVGLANLSVYNGTLAQMEAFYPDWAIRKSSAVPPPPPPPPAPITKKYFIPSIADLNMRSSPTTTTTTNKVGKAVLGGENEIFEEKDIEGYHFIKTKTWMATNGFGSIVEVK